MIHHCVYGNDINDWISNIHHTLNDNLVYMMVIVTQVICVIYITIPVGLRQSNGVGPIYDGCGYLYGYGQTPWNTSTRWCMEIDSSKAEIRICVIELADHWFRWWLGTKQAPSHYINQLWFHIIWVLGNKCEWNFNQNMVFFIQGN